MTDDAYDVPDGAPAYECRYCGRPFAREEWLALHRGLDHPERLDDEEVTAFRAAHEAEESELGSFRLRALGALVVIYFCLLMIYALV
ncbi:C2H2-type zinc finger protein [Haloarcula sp. S1CR25-12]|uniref:C2H2-type zinc finger protein n=1 Tax=Haloarcula saliterrae TaxID=2950534 RepID=A0ABU2FAH6_9EURY|nr:C2H2-type zinc finger protein [Haloarcula sp. S1CR25-12]MDS0259226.1 C2H2-type zinc finger protein [Haloarcula sp. S1CR25-12]